MYRVGQWVEGVEPYKHEWAEYGAEFPDPSKYLVEITETSYGDIYVIDKQVRVSLFSHEEPGFERCDTTLEGLLDAYFTDPPSLDMPTELGWVAR
jgi:hypothetical protein